MRIYVGNLSYETSEDELRNEFIPFGQVESVSIPIDRVSNRPKGFAFIEMPNVAEGQAAIVALNGKSFKDRALTVAAARPREDRGSASGSYGGRR